MTRRLILIRHAKSSWDNPGQKDHDRPLNPRGQKAALAIGQWLVAQGYVPDTVLSSSARRTLETWQGLTDSLGNDAELRVTPALFHPSPSQMLSVLKKATGACVLMLSHNPGIARFAADLLAPQTVPATMGRYPTCATAVIDFDLENWTDLRLGTGELTDFITPRDLP